MVIMTERQVVLKRWARRQRRILWSDATGRQYFLVAPREIHSLLALVQIRLGWRRCLRSPMSRCSSYTSLKAKHFNIFITQISATLSLLRPNRFGKTNTERNKKTSDLEWSCESWAEWPLPSSLWTVRYVRHLTWTVLAGIFTFTQLIKEWKF